MKKLFLALVVLLVSCSFVFAGGSAEAAESSDDGQYKVALIIENTIDDRGWCQSMHEGILGAMEQLPGKIHYEYSERMTTVDSESIARQYIADGFDLIIAHGAQYKNMVSDLAAEFPDVSFAFGTSSDIVGDNVFTYMPESEETGYLSGLLAGMLTKKNNIGFVGPVDSGDAARYARGFVLGVKEVNPDATLNVAFIGSFSDYVRSGELATTQILAGADVLTGASQQAIGALRACAEYPDVLWLGQDLAQLETPEGQAKCVAASAYNYTAVVVGLINSLDEGVKGGVCIPMNFNNDGFVFDYNPALSNLVTDEIRAKVDAALESFKAAPGVISNWADVQL
ncbi:MAG TPA: BMP family protein [Candidatus Ornithospirochaeta stercorigallinarum]|nr:BMP family protein [Candidatus Ornithospirochaeta stercorigallinarum]